MHPTAPRVDRDEIVRIITNFYTFLTKLHIPESALKLPPPGGWPNITPESTRNFNKSPLVIDLIKHLPYIDSKEAGEMITHVQYKCDVVDWSIYTPQDFDKEGEGDYRTAESGIRYWISEIREEQKRQEEIVGADAAEGRNNNGYESDESDGWGEDWERFSPGENPEVTDLPNLIGIAQGYESCGRDFTLDVFKGVVYDDQIRCNFLGGWDVEDFFRGLQQEFEDLELVPIRGDMLEADYEQVNEYREIYRRHGWPGADFRKAEALAAVEIARQRWEREEELASGY
ncbi:hypothetical protein E8E13_001504 [Curvularia kusanoi]|uniref:Uncharacterized protein n=1 Tax=Curvularia kusanoi TaxID=90978 RepID=A0A9P4T3T1_CURKU|nr:hypothetical protein E8E13_001504 [Curvularia kusanoi]